ncbi:MAG: mechanosensitive ion channel [Bacteroidales bacterium]|nr:mechanosensitive ion channel [Bacteroidales bacterium]
MLLLDDNTNALIVAQATQNTPPAPAGPLGEKLLAIDSTTSAVKDSLSNLTSLSDLKEVVTGENTIVKDALSALVKLSVEFVPKLLVAIVILWVGMKLVKMLRRVIQKSLDKRGAESSLKTFLGSLVDVLLKAMIIIMAMDVVGIKATSFIALLGAMGLAVGMALQGTLQNFAGGVIILLMKPFKVGDYVECGSYKGYIKEIRIFHTFMKPFNGRIIIIPNSELATKSLINHTKEDIIRLDVVASVAYGTNVDEARETLREVVDADELILKDPLPKIAVTDLGNSSVDFSLWLWVKTEDYWTVRLRIKENIYNKFMERNIEIPFPQVTVHNASK